MQSNNLFSKLARKPVAFLFVLLFAGVGGSLITFSRAATEGIISLTPASGQYAVGATVPVAINSNSFTTPVNAVQTELTYDATKLEYLSISDTGSAYGVAAPTEISPGKVKIPRGSITPVSGTQLVATVNFKALTPGTAAINLSMSTSELLKGDDSSNILTSVNGASYTIADTAPPTSPGVAASTGSTATSITLSWPAATDNVAVTGYDIYRNGVKVGSSTSLSYTDTGLRPANSYTYTIAARDNAGNESPKSTAVMLATKPDTTAPGTVSGVTSGTQTPTSITLGWTVPTDDVGVTSYKIYRNGVLMGTSTSPTYTSTGLEPDTNYSFTVVALDAAGNASPESAGSSFRTAKDTSAPTVPAGLTSQSSVIAGAKLTWTASTDNVAVTGYRIYRDSVQIGTSTATTYTDTGLAIGTTYKYSVAAVDAAGNLSTQSNQISVTLSLKPGDNNADDKVDLTDLSILLQNYGKAGATRLKGDQNQDGVVNLYDLSVLLANWGK